MKKVLVMLSGGVESTALVQTAITNYFDVECLHVVWNNKTSIEGKHARMIAEYYDVPYSEMRIEADEFKKYKDAPRKDSTWWACGLLTYGPIGGYNELWFGTHRDEGSPTALGPAGLTLMLQSVGCNATVETPLHMHSKQEQWSFLPDKVREMVTTCNNPGKDEEPCGKCEKCIEWKSFAINV